MDSLSESPKNPAAPLLRVIACLAGLAGFSAVVFAQAWTGDRIEPGLQWPLATVPALMGLRAACNKSEEGTLLADIAILATPSLLFVFLAKHSGGESQGAGMALGILLGFGMLMFVLIILIREGVLFFQGPPRKIFVSLIFAMMLGPILTWAPWSATAAMTIACTYLAITTKARPESPRP